MERPKKTIAKSAEGEDTESVVKAALKDKSHSSVSHLLLVGLQRQEFWL